MPVNAEQLSPTALRDRMRLQDREIVRLRQQLANAQEAGERARRSAESAWLLLKQLRGR